MRLLAHRTAVLTCRTLHAAAHNSSRSRSYSETARLNLRRKRHIRGSDCERRPHGASQDWRSFSALRPLCSRMTAAEPQKAPSLDRDKFSSTLELKALRLPTAQTHTFMQAFAAHKLDRPRLKSVLKDEADPSMRLLLLREDIKDADLTGLPEELCVKVRDAGIEVVDHHLTLGYSYWPTDLILKQLLPEGSEVPSSFETVGHIAHLNIRDELVPFKHVIGQVIIDKNPNIKTVVNKVGAITNDYRVFEMEVVAGEPRFETEVVQYKAKFRLDFSKVYWNSRLEHEHSRLVKTFRPNDVILDVMAGIGPFAIPAAQRGCKVFANDLNPDSHKYLATNIRINKVSELVEAHNRDGREFIRSLSASGGPTYSRVIMNLPASAVTFLDAFQGACTDARWRGCLPMVHCYTFSKGDEDYAGVRGRVEEALGGALDAAPEIHLVREVAPNKRMLCVSFALPEAVAMAAHAEHAAADAPAAKAELAAAPAAAASAHSEQTSEEPPCKKPRT